MGEVVELVESKIVPRDLIRNLSVLSRSGELLEAPVEAWVFGILAILSDQQQAGLFNIVRRAVADATMFPDGIITPMGRWIQSKKEVTSGDL